MYHHIHHICQYLAEARCRDTNTALCFDTANTGVKGSIFLSNNDGHFTPLFHIVARHRCEAILAWFRCEAFSFSDLSQAKENRPSAFNRSDKIKLSVTVGTKLIDTIDILFVNGDAKSAMVSHIGNLCFVGIYIQSDSAFTLFKIQNQLQEGMAR